MVVSGASAHLLANIYIKTESSKAVNNLWKYLGEGDVSVFACFALVIPGLQRVLTKNEIHDTDGSVFCKVGEGAI